MNAPTATMAASEEQASVGNRQLYSFATGELGLNLSWNMLSGFILFYYSNIALLPVAAVGTLLLVTRILDALIDPVIGVAVDKTNTRFGRARPWLLFAGVPFAVLTIMVFNVPDWSDQSRLIYAFITFALVGLCYSGIYIPYNAMAPMLTSNPSDKLKLGSFRSMAASAGSIVIYGAMMPLVGWLGGDNAQRGFTLTSAIMACATALIAMFIFFSCREQPRPSAYAKPEPFKHGLRDMFRNPVWVVAAGFCLAMFLRLGAIVSSTAYFAVDVLGRPTAAGLLLSALSFSILAGGFLARFVLPRTGLRAGNLIALALAILLSGAQALSADNVVLFGIFYMLGNVSLGIQSASIYAMISDTVDEQEQRFGSRNEGLLSSTLGLAMKIGMAVGASGTAYGLAALGYVPNQVDEAMRSGISLIYFGAPALFAGLQAFIVFFYRKERP